MERIGMVISVKNGDMEVKVSRESACGGSCGSCGGCSDEKGHILRVANFDEFKVGEIVQVKGDFDKIAKASLILYLFPLFFLVAGIFASYILFERMGFKDFELMSVIAGLISLFIGFLILRYLDNRSKEKIENLIKISRLNKK